MDDQRIAHHARAHHGVFSDAVLRRFGISDQQARRRVASGAWQRLHCGVYVGAATPDSFELHAEAALTALPAGALARRAAAHVLGFGLESNGRPAVEVVVPPGSTNRLAGVAVRQAPLPAHHVIRRAGFRVTNVERTLVDLGADLRPDPLQRTIEDLLIARRTTLVRIEAMFGELATRGRPGVARVRTVLGRLDDEPPTESELEAMFCRLLERHRLLTPRRQASFDWLAGGAGRVDFWYPDHHLVVELDGRRFHARSAAYEADRRRDQQALIHGIRTVRFPHRQLTTDRRSVVDVMTSLVGPEASPNAG